MKELPLFPLNLVAFPSESINLHIFEPRYKQLINDCLEKEMNFGIPSYVRNKIELGTEVEITEVTKRYPDGRLDIKTRGLNVFKVLNYENPWKDRLYAGGMVSYVEQDMEYDFSKLFEFKELVGSLMNWLDEEGVIDPSNIKSVFDIGHKIGFKLDEEYTLIEFTSEEDRLVYAVEHLTNLIPALERAKNAQDRIRQNGHFKHLDPLRF